MAKTNTKAKETVQPEVKPVEPAKPAKTTEGGIALNKATMAECRKGFNALKDIRAKKGAAHQEIMREFDIYGVEVVEAHYHKLVLDTHEKLGDWEDGANFRKIKQTFNRALMLGMDIHVEDGKYVSQSAVQAAWDEDQKERNSGPDGESKGTPDSEGNGGEKAPKAKAKVVKMKSQKLCTAFEPFMNQLDGTLNNEHVLTMLGMMYERTDPAAEAHLLRMLGEFVEAKQVTSGTVKRTVTK